MGDQDCLAARRFCRELADWFLPSRWQFRTDTRPNLITLAMGDPRTSCQDHADLP